MSTEAFLDMWNEFDDECSKVDELHGNMKEAIIAKFDSDDECEDEEPIITFDIPYINEKTAEVFESINPLYFFDYLPTETIIRIFETHVDRYREIGGSRIGFHHCLRKVCNWFCENSKKIWKTS